jgi:hypothetical protein
MPRGALIPSFRRSAPHLVFLTFLEFAGSWPGRFSVLSVDVNPLAFAFGGAISGTFMKLSRMMKMAVVVSALVLGTSVLRAQETNQIDQLKRQLEQMQKNFDRVVQEQRQQIEALQKQVERLSGVPSTAAPPAVATSPPVEARPSAAAPQAAAVADPWTPTSPIRFGTARNYINLSFDALVAAGGSTANDIEGGTQLGGHDPKQRGFTVQNLEAVFDGKVDPYFRGQANIVLQLDTAGETTIEAEEAYLETMSLPWNLQVKAGQFFTEFGRINPVHPHAWDFVDQPLINGRLLGEDGLRNPGARLSWLTPTPFYSEFFIAVQNSQGETAFSFRDDHEGEALYGRLHQQGRVKAFNDLVFVPRYVAAFNLSDSQTLVAGVSAAFGPNASGTTTDTQIYGVDLFWKWKSPNHHAGFPFVTWQTEAMLRKYQAGAFDWDSVGATAGVLDADEQDLNGDGIPDVLPRETLTDYGIYSQVSYGFRKGWVAALRGDWVSSDVAQYETALGRDPARATRWRIAPNLTWYPSEFSKIRLQYNYDRRTGIGDDHSVWLQFEFLLGTHAAHKF